MELREKLAVLYASCASSGGQKRDAGKTGGIGASESMGICHAYAPDGRSYDCAYCISRRSCNVWRTRFSVDEVVRLTKDFYRRNYIEGLLRVELRKVSAFVAVLDHRPRHEADSHALRVAVVAWRQTGLSGQ
jgi:predicted DNA-binding helix-hairpin-helix protein